MNRRLTTVIAYASLGLVACGAVGERTYGGARNQNATGARPTAEGGAIIAGYTANNTAGATDAYLLKVDDAGAVQWSLTHGGAGFDRAEDVVAATDGGYFVAITTESEGPGDPEDFGSYVNVKLLKVDGRGAIVWQRVHGEARPDGVASLAATVDGGVVLAGYTHNTADGPAALVLRYTATGELAWTTKLEAELPKTIAHAVAVATDGSIVLAGSTFAPDGNTDAFVARLTAAGAILWARPFGDELNEQFHDVRATPDGGVIAAGYRSEWWPELRNTDAIVVKYGADGFPEWDGTYGGARNDEAAAITPVADGYVFTGATHSYGSGTELSADVWVSKLSLTGALVWNRAHGGGGNNYGTDIRELAGGALLVVGDTFPELALINAYDIYVARLTRDGQLQ